MFNKLLLIICGVFLAISCATTESTSDEDDSRPSEPDNLAEDYRNESLSNTERLLLSTRSQLSNHYSEDMVYIPDLYLQEIVMNERKTDPYAGFRVQLLSTRNVAEADSVRDYFVAWADSVIAGYEPDAYVVFRSPHYRVRAGDFQDRERAVHFSGMLKNRYPDAWVVHERIEPSKTPADTTDIRFKDLDAIEFEEEMRMMESESADTTSLDR
ncbi:SPOR domain-containing protein [Rhodohalobacter sp. 8-1]|uniref:SPOR domain-containing protein n=1 Tax=Rhodohalobacter sp. 8-1 TaxID=3131972 RepID=UPI0030EDE023